MPGSAVKKPGDPVRVRRTADMNALIEDDWKLIRFEPDSGNLIAEKNGKRVVCSRGECETLNFPGSDEVWGLLNSEPDDKNLCEARCAWTELNLCKTASCLLEYGRALDPALASCQTCADFASKVRSITEACESALVVLRMDIKRAEAEYKRCPAGSSFNNDLKDDCLSRWRYLQEKYAAKAHCRDNLIPACGRLAKCLDNLEAARKSQ